MKLNKKLLKDAAESYVKKEIARKKRILQGMTTKKVEKILKVLRKEHHIVDENVLYETVKGINIDELNDFCEYLQLVYLPNFTTDTYYDYTGPSSFPDYRAHFQYKRTKFILRLLIGQGASWALLDLEAQSKTWPSKKNPMLFLEDKKMIIKMEDNYERVH